MSYISYTKAIPTIQQFGGFVIENHKKISPQVFAEEFGKIQKTYLAAKQKELFCSEAETLAHTLAENKHNDFAGIIMSALCKIVQYWPEQLEHFAQKGYEIAKINGDNIHMMARLNDLRKIYQDNPARLFDYIQVLYKQEKCLKELTNHYEEATASYRSIMRKPATKQEYKTMLAFVQTEIGKLTRRKHPIDAMKKLYSAKETFEKTGNLQSVKYIEMLLDKIQQTLNRSGC